MSESIKIRKARVADLPFLQDMLYEAAAFNDWIRELGKTKALALPQMILNLQDFGFREKDFGFIAESIEDETPVGAVWARIFPKETKGCVFVAENVPTLAIAVASEWRGRGIGTRLLEELIKEARTLNFPAISLSVERSNPALRLYQKLGFEDTGISKGNASALTLILHL